jgi:hypothetical protein
MAHDEDAERGAQAQQYESSLIVRMVRVVNQKGALVEKDGLGFLERHAVLAPVQPILLGIPFESKVAHAMLV